MEQQKNQNSYSIFPREIVDVTRKRDLKHDSFVRFLTKEYGASVASTLVRKYGIAASKQGTLLWMEDKERKFRTGKILEIDFTSGAVTAEAPMLVHEIFAESHGINFSYSGCCFGDHHLIEAFFQTKAIVTDPQLCIVLSALINDVVWFASPFKSQVDIKAVISGYTESQLFLFPDDKQHQVWAEALKNVDSKAIVLSNQLVDLYPILRKDGLQKNSGHMQNVVSRIKSVIADAVPF